MHGQLTTQFQAFALLLCYKMQQVGVSKLRVSKGGIEQRRLCILFGKSDRFTIY